MPSYVKDAVPYKVPPKTEKAITKAAVEMSPSMKAFS